MAKYWNWKSKTLLVLTLLVVLVVGLGSIDRKVGGTTWDNWWECIGQADNVQQTHDYNIIFNKCAIIYHDDAGNEIKRVHANLDINTDSE